MWKEYLKQNKAQKNDIFCINGNNGNNNSNETANKIIVETSTIILCDDINEYLVRDIINALPTMVVNCKKHKFPLGIKINSIGGNLTDTQAIVTELLRCKVPICVDILGYAFSGAAMISLCGDDVKMSKLGLWMMHYPNWEDNDPSWYSHKQTTNITCEHYERIMATLLRKTKLNIKMLREYSIKNDWYITPKECLKLGLVDELY